tara:strand:- start:876 stop:1043 length:168 start_codon:yes stop_codon:yes gene_type:complete
MGYIKNDNIKEIIVLERDEFSPEVWEVYCNLFCSEGENVDVIKIDINVIEYFENN